MKKIEGVQQYKQKVTQGPQNEGGESLVLSVCLVLVQYRILAASVRRPPEPP